MFVVAVERGSHENVRKFSYIKICEIFDLDLIDIVMIRNKGKGNRKIGIELNNYLLVPHRARNISANDSLEHFSGRLQTAFR